MFLTQLRPPIGGSTLAIYFCGGIPTPRDNLNCKATHKHAKRDRRLSLHRFSDEELKVLLYRDNKCNKSIINKRKN